VIKLQHQKQKQMMKKDANERKSKYQ